MSEAVCIIPARGGSKRIERKNVRSFRGKPIIQYSIEVAFQSGCFDREDVVISTDDQEIADVAKRLGAQVPFLRSEVTSTDDATTAAAVGETIVQLERLDRTYQRFCCLYPTAPLCVEQDLREGEDLLLGGGFDAVIAIARFSYPVWKSVQRDQDGRVSRLWPEHENARSQDLPAVYHDAGQWYWRWVSGFDGSKAIASGNVGSVVLPNERVQDIDTESDWKIAEMKHKVVFG